MILVKNFLLVYSMDLCTLHQDTEQDLYNLLTHKGKGPCEDVHVIWEHKRMLSIVVLLNLDLIVFKTEDCCLVVVNVTVIRSREDRYD